METIHRVLFLHRVTERVSHRSGEPGSRTAIRVHKENSATKKTPVSAQDEKDPPMDGYRNWSELWRGESCIFDAKKGNRTGLPTIGIDKVA